MSVIITLSPALASVTSSDFSIRGFLYRKITSAAPVAWSSLIVDMRADPVQRRLRTNWSGVPEMTPVRPFKLILAIASIQMPRVAGEHFESCGSESQLSASNSIGGFAIRETT